MCLFKGNVCHYSEAMTELLTSLSRLHAAGGGGGALDSP
jgi:hypothetical protein